MNVKLKKLAKRQIYNFSKANWKDLNYDLKRVNWNSIASYDAHTSWKLFKFVLSKLCDKHIHKISVKRGGGNSPLNILTTRFRAMSWR